MHEDNLFFIDSYTTHESVALQLARGDGGIGRQSGMCSSTPMRTSVETVRA